MLVLRGKDRERPTGAQGFIGGAVSSSLGEFMFGNVSRPLLILVPAVLLLYPLILAKTRLQSYSKPGDARKPNLLSVLGDILSTHGVAGLYQGLLVQLSKVRDLPSVYVAPGSQLVLGISGPRSEDDG